MGKKFQEVSRFSLEGQFIRFVGDVASKPKRLQVATSEGDREIKLAKALRGVLGGMLQPGDWIQVSGEQKRKATGELRLKAVVVNKPGSRSELNQRPDKPRTTACVLVCQKSSCCKRGAGEVRHALTEALRDRGLADQVAIKGTGCMKQCKQGPCIVVMPDKARYTGVMSKDVNGLLKKHFAHQSSPEGSTLSLASVT